MTTINTTTTRNNFFKMLETCIKHNEKINIATKRGNVVLLKEEEYEGLKETAFLNAIPKMKEDIINGLKTPLSECKEINLETIQI